MKNYKQRRLLCSTAVICLLVMPAHAQAEPEGGNVTSGNASIQNIGNTTTINQTSDRAIIRWDSFDVGASQSVQFNQPNSGSITVNRIRDTKASKIDGHIGANGNIILINPNGVVFGATSTVNVGSLVATTSDIEDDTAFMNGGAVKFTKPGAPDGKIINNGTMTVRDGGLVGLVAPNVENHGVIQAKLGKVALASGDIATIDFAGDGLIKLEVTDAVLSQRVLNTGTIIADGGDILLTAAQARGMVDSLVTNTGTLQAKTVKVAGVEKTGSVTLSTKGLDLSIPRSEGVVFNTGKIDVESIEPETKGGEITILADKIEIGDGSYVTAAGDAGGGTIKIGGNYQGGSGLPTSDMVFISEHVILNAGSRRSGKGGTIILWSDTNTRFYGHGDVSGVDGGGFIEVSGKEHLDYAGTVNLSSVNGSKGVLLLDPTDIVISSGTNNNITGTAPFTPVADNGATVLNVTTLLNALASGNVIVQTRASGSQQGNITVDSALTWSNGNTLTLDAHNHVIVNQAISGSNLTFVVGNDLQLNANISGTGTLTIQQASDSGTVGIGASSVGTLNLSAADITRIVDGWNEIVIGKSTATAGMDIRTVTLLDNVKLLSGTGTITFTNTLNVGANNLTIITDGDIALPGALTGTGTLTIQQASAGTGMGIGASQTGAVNLTNTEIGKITNGWGNIILGRSDGTGTLNFNTLSWNDHLTILSNTGVININGTQTMTTGNNLSIVTDADIVMTGSLAGSSTSNLSIAQRSAATSMGFGDTQTGTINFTTTEVSKFTNGWNTLTFGRADSTADMNVGALTWNDHLTMMTGSGVIRVNGNQTLTGANLTYQTNADLVLNGTLTGNQTLTFVQSSVGTSMAIGDGQAGTYALSSAELANITDGWAGIVIGRTDSTGNVNVGAATWRDSISFQSGSGIINITGTQTTTGTSAMTIRTDSNVNIGADLMASGGLFTLVQVGIDTSMGIGTGQAGTVHLDDAETARILNGWSNIYIGRSDGTGALNVGSNTWDDPLVLKTGSGALNINGAQTMGGNALTITTDSDLYIGGNLSGSGNIVIQGSANTTSIALGTGQTGTLYLDNSEITRIANGWGNVYFGTTSGTGDMNIGAATWQDKVYFRTASGVISFNGAQNFSGNAASITSNVDSNINAVLSGTSSLTFTAGVVSTTIGIGTGQVGTINFSDAEIDRMANTFSIITIGSSSHSGAVNIGATTWKDPLTVRNTSGQMTINGDINMGSNNLTLTTNSNLILNGNLIGTGTLALGASSSNISVGIGDGQTGTQLFTEAKLARMTGWSTLVFTATGTGALNIGGRTWNQSLDLRVATGDLNINGVLNMGTNNLTIRTNANLTLSQNLVGTGILTFVGLSNGTTIAVGNGQTGTLELTNTELGYIVDGWSQIVFGSSAGTGTINVGARTWNDSVEFRTLSGAITIAGAQNMGANNLSIKSDVNPNINAALTGTGNLQFSTFDAKKTFGVGSGAGTFSIDDTELARITDGWNLITFGANNQTADMIVGARTWSDNVAFTSSFGVITFSGAQNVGANDLTIVTSGNLTLSDTLTGTGTLTIHQNSAPITMGLGSTAGGSVNLSDTELNRISDGWSNLVFGREDTTATFTVTAYTWKDNVTFRVGTGIMTISGNQTLGANNLTIAANSDLALNANLTGTGRLTIRGSSIGTTIGVGTGQAGTLALSATDLSKIVNGWAGVTIGSVDGAGNINIGANTWGNATTFVTKGNVILNGVQTSSLSSGTSLVFATINSAFINNAGANAINPGGGRYLVYSVADSNDTLGGIVRPGIVTNKTYAGYGPSSVTESGSQHLYSGAVSKVLFLSIDNLDKIYGDSLPIFTYSYINGLVNGDTLADAIQSYTMNAVGSSVYDNAGTTRTITGNFVMKNGYSVVTTNGTLTVTKATLVVEADPVSRIYGTSNPSFSASYTGFKNGEDETDIDTLATSSTLANINSDVGSYAITSSGASDNNYDFIYTDGSLSINKATLTATVQNATRQYGDANPTFTFTYTGFKNGQNASVIDTQAVGTTTANATSNVGTYTVTGGSAFDNNYTFNYVNGSLSVTKATLTAKADDVARTYGDANPALGVTYTGFKNGETAAVIDTQATASTAATAASNVNTYTITASGASDNNYDFVYNAGTLTVNKAVLTATAGNGSRIYGDGNPTINVTYSGFKNSDGVGNIDTQATASSAANAFSDVGTYTTVASGASDDNYTFNYVNGSLSVTKATLTATANNSTRYYGDSNHAIGVTYTGFKNGQNASVIDTGATGFALADENSDVGTYTTRASGASDNNYDFSYVDGTLTVNKSILTVAANNATRAYGDANPTIGVTYTGFKNGQNSSVLDTLASASSSATATSDVGTYSTVATGGFDNNYIFNYVDGSLSVTKAILTATAGSANRIYGDANPTMGVTYSGFKNGENDSVIDTGATASSAANALSNVGSYTTVASGAADDNYTFSYVNGALLVTKANVVVTADNTSRTYGATNPAFTATYTGFKNGQDASVIDTLAAGSTNASATSGVGAYSISMAGASDNNYSFTYASGVLSVTKAALVARADDASRKEGQANPALGVTYTGFMNGENASVLQTMATASTAANTASAKGSYAITVSGGFDANYTFSYADGTLTVLDRDYVPPVAPVVVGLPSTVIGTITESPTVATAQNIVTQTWKTRRWGSKSRNTPSTAVVNNEPVTGYLWQDNAPLISITDFVRDDYFVNFTYHEDQHL